MTALATARPSSKVTGPLPGGSALAGRFRYWFASQVSAWAFIPVVPVQVFGFVDRGLPWRGEWLWTMDWAGTPLFIIGVVVAAATAVDAGRVFGNRRGWLVDAAPSRWKPAISVAVPCLIGVVSAHLLTVAAYLLTTATVASVAPPPAVWVMLLAQLVGLAFLVALGVVAGLLLGPVLGPIAAAAIVLAAASGADSGSFVPVAFGSATGSLVGYDLSYGSYALQLGVLGSVLALAATVRLRTTPAGTRVPTVAGALALALAVAVFLGSHWIGPDRRFVLSDTARPDACVGAEVSVCFFPEHRHLAESIVDDVEALYRVAAARGVDDLLPDRVVEHVPGHTAVDGAAGMMLSPDEVENRGIAPVRLAQEIVTPDHCPQLYADAPPTDEYWLSVEGLIIYLTSLETYVVEMGFPSFEAYRDYAAQTGGGLVVPDTAPRELDRIGARQALERLRACDF